MMLAAICVTAQEQDKKFKVQVFCPQPELLYKQSGDFPFAYYWRRDYIDIRKFEKIQIKPVADNFWFDGQDRNNGQLKNDLNRLSETFVGEIKKAIDAEGKMIELKVTDEVDAKTMILEVAMVPVMPLDYYLRMLSYYGSKKYTGINLPYGMLCMNMVVIEAVVRNGENGEPVAQMASLCGTAKDVKTLTENDWIQAVNPLLADWSMKFVSTIKAELNRGKDGTYLSISGKITTPAAPEKDQKK